LDTRTKEFGIPALATGALGILIWRIPFFGMALLPGMLLAAIVFPEGVHSSFGGAYIFLAFLISEMLLYWVFWLVTKLVLKHR
jgi:hypothetical protein